MSSSTNSEEIIVEFQKKIECFNTIKQLAVVQKKELVFKTNDSLKRPSYNL